MKLMSYSEALKLGKDAIKETLIPVRVNKAKKQAELEMCKLDEEIAVLESAINEMCYAEELNFKGMIDKQDKLALVKRKKEQYQAILTEMFPEKP